MEKLRPYLEKLGCKICSPDFYRGKVYPKSAFISVLKWKLWDEKPDYEFEQFTKGKVA